MKLFTALRRKAFPLILMYSIASILCCLTVPMATSSSSPVTFGVVNVTDGVPAGELVTADIYIDAPEGSAIVGWTIDVAVNPDVLEPGFWFFPPGDDVWVRSCASGYFIYDWATANNYTTGCEEGDINKTAGTITRPIEVVAGCWGFDPGTGASGTGKLATLFFTSKNKTAYSPIEITLAFYYTTWNNPNPHPDKQVPGVLHGHYNMPAYIFPVTVDGLEFDVVMESNSTISDFEFRKDQKEIRFSVTGPNGTVGFCNVAIDKDLLWLENFGDVWVVLIDGVTAIDLLTTENATHTFIHFTYTHTTHSIIIRGTGVVPEFPTPTSLLLMLAVLAVSAIILKRRTQKHLRRRLRREWE